MFILWLIKFCWIYVLGINSLYVYVVFINEVVVKFYNKGGFIFEKEDVLVISWLG